MSCDSGYRNLTTGTPHVRKDRAVRENRKPFPATACSGNSNSRGFQRLNIARIYCFLRMSTTIAYPVERLEPSPLNLSNGLSSSFQVTKASYRFLSNSLHESRNVNWETS